MGRLTPILKGKPTLAVSLRLLPSWACIYDVGASAALVVKFAMVEYRLILCKKIYGYIQKMRFYILIF
jgi:hypothetical protein